MLQFNRFLPTILVYRKDRSEISYEPIDALRFSIRIYLYPFMLFNTFDNLFQVCLWITSLKGVVNVSEITTKFSLFLDQAAFESLVCKRQGCSHSCQPSPDNQSSGNNVNNRFIKWLDQPCLGYRHTD
jgi:hypothetical protein